MTGLLFDSHFIRSPAHGPQLEGLTCIICSTSDFSTKGHILSRFIFEAPSCFVSFCISSINYSITACAYHYCCLLQAAMLIDFACLQFDVSVRPTAPPVLALTQPVHGSVPLKRRLSFLITVPTILCHAVPAQCFPIFSNNIRELSFFLFLQSLQIQLRIQRLSLASLLSLFLCTMYVS